MQMSRYSMRDITLHEELAAEIVWAVIMGHDVAPDHPELLAFRRGMTMQCRNGFRFDRVSSTWFSA
jgi:hypothetical protein